MINDVSMRCFLNIGVIAILKRHLSLDRSQSAQTQQVVGSADQVGVQLHAGDAAEAGPTQAAIGLHPAEDGV